MSERAPAAPVVSRPQGREWSSSSTGSVLRGSSTELGFSPAPHGSGMFGVLWWLAPSSRTDRRASPMGTRLSGTALPRQPTNARGFEPRQPGTKAAPFADENQILQAQVFELGVIKQLIVTENRPS